MELSRQNDIPCLALGYSLRLPVGLELFAGLPNEPKCSNKNIFSKSEDNYFTEVSKCWVASKKSCEYALLAEEIESQVTKCPCGNKTFLYL